MGPDVTWRRDRPRFLEAVLSFRFRVSKRMWTYIQRTGEILDKQGRVVGKGYAGRGKGKNNPGMQAVKNVGPLPVGIYTIAAPVNTKKHGPYVLWLTPDPANEMYGRASFGIHGDKKGKPGTASDGCIAASKGVRVMIWESFDHLLRVIADREAA